MKTIVPVKLSVTEGDIYTLFSPKWKESGAEWQAFLGKGDELYAFTSEAELLAFLNSGEKHDFEHHPDWGKFTAQGTRRVFTDGNHYDLVWLPGYLAERPSYEAVRDAGRVVSMARSLGNVASLEPVMTLFRNYSLLSNLDRGAEHYQGDNGEWDALGRTVYNHWDSVLDAIDACYTLKAQDADTVARAEEQLTQARAELAAEKEAEENKATAADVVVDAYDTTVWGQSGIDPIRITIDGRTLYTLRSYVNRKAVFLGKFGQITTFNNRKAMRGWLLEHKDHDLAALPTWSKVMDAANDGTLDVTVDPVNSYVFTGLREDIAKGPKSVDKEQLALAYELLADTADWAEDDAVNSVLVANPKLQEFIAYVVGSPTGYIPDAPFTAEEEGWKALETGLIARFSKY